MSTLSDFQVKIFELLTNHISRLFLVFKRYNNSYSFLVTLCHSVWFITLNCFVDKHCYNCANDVAGIGYLSFVKMSLIVSEVIAFSINK